MTEIVFTNARVVTRDAVVAGSVRVGGGRIASVDPGTVARGIDLEGDYLLPGLVDLHTDALEAHYQPRPGVHWNPLAAALAHDAQIAASGITTVCDAVAVGCSIQRADRREILAPLVDGLRRAVAAGALRAEHRLHLRMEVTDPEVEALIEPFRGDPLVGFASLMDHAPGQRQSPDVDVFKARHRDALGGDARKVDAVVDALVERSRTIGPEIRRRLAELARAESWPLASHDDDSPAHVALAREEGCVVVEFPTTLAAAEAAEGAGLGILMGGPNVVRGASTYGNVSGRELARRGLLDMLASDYVPASMLHAVFALAEEEGLDLPRAVCLASLAPAEAAGLDDRGEIRAGKRADLIRVRLVDGLPVVRDVRVAGERVA